MLRIETARLFPYLAGVLLVSGLTVSGVSALSTDVKPKLGLVGREGTHFILDGKPLFVAGVNNHYLPFASPEEVRRVLDDSVAMGATVMRTFIQPVVGSLDGVSKPTIWDWRKRSQSSDLSVHGNYILYWDPVQNAMAINEGPNGLQRLDFLLAEAGKRKLKLIIAMLDFWDYTGGAQQMRAWYGSQDKNTFFFEDERTKADFKRLIRSVLLRTNTFTGVSYKEDPTIFAWELMNEPEAKPTSLLYRWVEEMSAYIKSIDPNHLVASGHENIENGLADIDIPSIDFATWHGYPIYLSKTYSEMNAMIKDYCDVGAKAGKPVLLEEFGYARSNPDHLAAYRQWLETINRHPDCAGWLVWRLVSLQDDSRYPADGYDQFDVHNDGGPLWNTLREGAQQMFKKGQLLEAAK